jgi:hypothetical protein
VKFAVAEIGSYGGSRYIRSHFSAYSTTFSKSSFLMIVFCNASWQERSVSTSQIVGLLYLPNGTLKYHLLFTLYRPLKHDLFI